MRTKVRTVSELKNHPLSRMRKKLIRRIYDTVGDEERKIDLTVGSKRYIGVSGAKARRSDGTVASFTAMPTKHLISISRAILEIPD